MALLLVLLSAFYLCCIIVCTTVLTLQSRAQILLFKLDLITDQQGPLGKDAVTEIHNIFKWAKNSSHGLILFIDEAEAFLSRREKDHSENIRNAVSERMWGKTQ